MKRRVGCPSGKGRALQDPELISLMVLVDSRRYSDVESLARNILGRKKDHPLALKALSFALLGTGRYEEALPVLEYAILKHADDPDLHNNLGIVLHSQMKWDQAESCFKHALKLSPRDHEIWKNLGVACFKQHRRDEAVSHLLRAIEYHPDDYREAIMHLADVLSSLSRLDEALVCINELRRDDPDNLLLLSQFLSVSLRNCDWVDFDVEFLRLRALSRDFVVGVGPPFGVFAFPGVTGHEHRMVGSNNVGYSMPQNLLAQQQGLVSSMAGKDRERLRIGYLSADFRQHPVAYVVAQVIELHDRSRFEVFAYSIGADDGSQIRKRLVAGFDRFTDVAPMSVYETARVIKNDSIDILIDLTGWTSDGRPESLALRCAPVQVNWLGYPGTLGHSNLADYLIGDPIVTPLENAAHFCETLALLPNCYLPADATRSVGAPPAREDVGLPENGFVFCSFNNSYKFNSLVWDLWCRILLATPESVLWLSAPSLTAQGHLRREAQERGVDPDRIIFAVRTETQEEHLARIQLADLALDPFPYNSHSTGIDTLWAGVPMISLLGDVFVSRVGASELYAAGLDELVTNTVEDYFLLALRLYQDRDYLQAMRDSFKTTRLQRPLFDMGAFARSLESLYCRMWINHCERRKEPIVSV